MNLIQGIILKAFLLWHCFYCKNTSVYKKEETKHDEHYLTSIRNHIRSSELSELSFTAVSTCSLDLKSLVGLFRIAFVIVGVFVFKGINIKDKVNDFKKMFLNISPWYKPLDDTPSFPK